MINSPTTAFSSSSSSSSSSPHDPRPIINLRDFVASVTKHNPSVFSDFNISPKWRCRLVPEFDDQERLIMKEGYSNNENNNKNLTMLHFFANGVPALASQSRSKPVHDICPDAMEFINDPKWKEFPAPKIAFRGGWAGPGTKMEDAKLHQMVRGFDEVLDASKCATDEELAKKYEVLKSDEAEEEAKRREEAGENGQSSAAATTSSANQSQSQQKHTSDEILNLQLFHRSDAALHPQLPILSENLKWPDSVSDASVICDNATRVSKAGAITWWHLDDCGEFVMQTGLDRKDPEKKLEGVKMFIYGPTASYDWFMHDAQSESNKSGKIAALDILKAPCDALPDAEYLPIMNVAVLQAGGRPLISPPNIPHIVITLRDCVMVEQRRVMYHFLHEVLYFAQRMQSWKSTPVIYPVLGNTLQDEEGVMSISVEIAKQLERVLESKTTNKKNDDDDSASAPLIITDEIKRLNAALCVRSLLALTNHQLFKGAKNEEQLGDRVRQIFSSFAEKIMPFYNDIQYIINAETEFLEKYCDVDRACWVHYDSDATFIFKMYQNNAIAAVGSGDHQNDDGDQDENTGRRFSCVLYYGGDLIDEDKNTKKNDENENNKKKNEDDEEEKNHPVIQKLKNGFLPCWIGSAFETTNEARNAGKKAVNNLKSTLGTAGCAKGKPITLEQIKEAFTERDEMLDEFF